MDSLEVEFAACLLAIGYPQALGWHGTKNEDYPNPTARMADMTAASNWHAEHCEWHNPRSPKDLKFADWWRRYKIWLLTQRGRRDGQ